MEPKSFVYQGKKYEIEKVELGSTPENKYFQIFTKDNKLFELRFNEAVFQWVLNEVLP